MLGPADQRGAHHGGADDGAHRSGCCSGRSPGRSPGCAGCRGWGARCGPSAGEQQPCAVTRTVDPLGAGAARLRAAVRDRRRDRRSLAEPRCCPTSRTTLRAAHLPHRRGGRDRARSGVPRAQPAGPSSASGVRRPAQHRFEWLAPGAARRRRVRAVPRGAGGGVLRRARLRPARHRAHLRGLRPPGLRPAHHRHRPDAARGLGGRAQGAAGRRRPTGGGCAARSVPSRCSPSSWSPRRCTGWTSTRTPTASPGCGCWSTSSRAGSGWSCSAVLVAGIRLRGWWLPADGAALGGGAAARARRGRTRTPGSRGTTSTATRRPARSTGTTCSGLSADATPTLADAAAGRGGLCAWTTHLPTRTAVGRLEPRPRARPRRAGGCQTTQRSGCRNTDAPD